MYRYVGLLPVIPNGILCHSTDDQYPKTSSSVVSVKKIPGTSVPPNV